MASVAVASFNVENLFARPKAFNTGDRAAGEPILAMYREFNTLIANRVYSAANRDRMREFLVALGIYHVTGQGAVRRRVTVTPRWAWLRKTEVVSAVSPATQRRVWRSSRCGRSDWIGWLELATETINEIGVRMTARIIADLDADIIAIIEAEDRPSLVRPRRPRPDRWERRTPRWRPRFIRPPTTPRS
jgi:hypothetical protein